MNCDEFLRQFREALEGKVSENLIQDNVNYYRSYINSQTANGRSELEVLHKLGDPRLLAKTIEESNKFASESQSSRNGYASGNEYYGNYGNYSHSSAKNKANEYSETADKRRFKLPGWLVTCIAMIAVVLLLTVVFRVFVFFAPVILIFVSVGFLVQMIRGWWRGK